MKPLKPSPISTNKTEKQLTGINGENKAVDFLLSKNYKLLERNYRFKKGEIDIILLNKDHDTVVFVEVKTRKDSSYGNPEDFVSESQENSILTVAEHYTNKNEWDGMIRFDIVSITNSTDEVLHHEDAFG